MNLELWNRVCTTDPKHAKFVNMRGGFTAIDAQYQRKTATEIFGVYGHGWKLHSFQWLYYPEEGEPKELILHAIFWAKYGEKEIDFPITVSMIWKPGDDCHKKLMTAATSKSLSYLGFNSDVFEGLYDDNQYVQSLRPPDFEKFKSAVDKAPPEKIQVLISQWVERASRWPDLILQGQRYGNEALKKLMRVDEKA